MQRKNVVSIDYFKDKARLADFLNGYVFKGCEIVHPEDIHENDSVLTRIWKEGGIIRSNVNIVDVMKKVVGEYRVFFITLQNQTDIHYAMPVRVMNQEATNYYNQWKEIQKNHRNTKDLDNSIEYLSGFSREDRLIPVLSVVIYFGSSPWDGPRTLKEIMDFTDCPEDLQRMIADYPINLFEVRRYPDLEYFQTDLREVFGFLQNTEDKEQLKEYVREHEDAFSDMAEEAFDLLSVMSHTRELELIKEKQKNPGGGYNMCKAIYDMVQDGVQEGQEIGQKFGQNRINLLNQRLLRDKRLEDLERSVSDEAFQMELLQEYAL